MNTVCISYWGGGGDGHCIYIYYDKAIKPVNLTLVRLNCFYCIFRQLEFHIFQLQITKNISIFFNLHFEIEFVDKLNIYHKLYYQFSVTYYLV